MLYCGEHIGTASEPLVDIAVDPLDGTTLVSQGRNGAVAVIAVAERGALFDPGPCMYMEKLAACSPAPVPRLTLPAFVALTPHLRPLSRACLLCQLAQFGCILFGRQ